VVLRRRLILLDGVPIEIADSYFLVGIARGTALAEAKKIRGGSVTLLASLGLVGKAADEEVEARQSTDEERSLLGIEVGEWVLHVLRTVRDPDGKPFEVTAMTMLARERILKYTVEIG
jgi:DNA-binding GntR family transcriptional regulator